jgi:hypothetical protein
LKGLSLRLKEQYQQAVPPNLPSDLAYFLHLFESDIGRRLFSLKDTLNRAMVRGQPAGSLPRSLRHQRYWDAGRGPLHPCLPSEVMERAAQDLLSGDQEQRGRVRLLETAQGFAICWRPAGNREESRGRGRGGGKSLLSSPPFRP